MPLNEKLIYSQREKINIELIADILCQTNIKKQKTMTLKLLPTVNCLMTDLQLIRYY